MRSPRAPTLPSPASGGGFTDIRSPAPKGGRHPTPSPASGGGLEWGPAQHDLHRSLAERVLYRDGLILIIDKPAGIAVHPGPGQGPDLESRFGELRFGLPHPPALAHRLDRDTAGCLVLGRHPKALRRLGALFAAGKVEKTYWAVVEGSPRKDRGLIDLALRKVSRGAGWRVVVDPQGQSAVTEFRVLGRAEGRAWLELRPRTGRTHQIRVHCAALGVPVAGDRNYGDRAATERLQLYARSVVLPLYPARAPVMVTAPVPPHMRESLHRLGWVEAKAA